MSWQNAFDLGECTVTLKDWNYSSEIIVWSGVLAKGDSHAGTTTGGLDYVLAVDADGKVSLMFGQIGPGNAFEVQVIPAYAHDFPARISGMSSDISANNITMAIGTINSSTGGEGVRYLPWESWYGSPEADFQPNPLDMSSLTGSRDMISVYMETPAA